MMMFSHEVSFLAFQSASDQLSQGLGNLFEILEEGGLMMIPIGLCSVVALAYTIERLINLRRGRIVPKSFVRSIKLPLEAGEVERAQRECESSKSPIARILLAGIKRRGRSLLEIEKAVEDAGQREIARMRRNVRPLNVVAGVSPLLGLLGTVVGMIESFNVVANQGLGKQELLADGISKALVTTGAGLTVAIPALALYYYFIGRIHKIVLEIDENCVELLEHVPDSHQAQIASDASSIEEPELVGQTS
ncbi:MAG: MotA/TolQ/ExbB proton channel family protein [Planctomycetota bacterium]